MPFAALCTPFAAATPLTRRAKECEADQEGTNVWPKGSSEYSDLFDWAAGNASKMFLADPVFIENFKELFRTCKIEVFDSFAGTGNGSTAFKLQHRALAEALRFSSSLLGIKQFNVGIQSDVEILVLEVWQCQQTELEP